MVVDQKSVTEEPMDKNKGAWRIPPEPIGEEQLKGTGTADVIVVGAAYAGTAAARAATEAGASVIVLEKMPKRKFFTFGVDFGHLNSSLFESRGVPKVDELEFLNDWQLRGGNRSNPKLVLQFCRNSGKSLDWMLEPLEQEQIDRIEVRYDPPPKYYTREIAGMKFWSGTATFPPEFSLSETVKINQEYAASLGANFRFGMTGCQLVQETGRVKGVIALDSDGKYHKYTALKGVILAAGDFSGNSDMLMELCEEIADLAGEGNVIRGKGQDGSGIQMGIWAGGILSPAPRASMGGNIYVPLGPLSTAATLWLDRNGNRYCNEGFGDMVFSAIEGARQPKGPLTSIFDSYWEETLQYQPPMHSAVRVNHETSIKKLREDLKRIRETGARGGRYVAPSGSQVVYCTDTLGELADCLGFEGESKQNFLASVERYNEFCQTGRDLDFGKDSGLLIPVNHPPYYGFQHEPDLNTMLLVTVDGLWTDEYQNVLNKDRQPIPGLYASGNCCGRRWGIQYSTPIAGVSIGMAWCLGREAGRHVAGL